MGIKKALGQKGEEIACKTLEENGYRLLDKNFRCKQGEIDVIADDRGVICFIEVKSRSSEAFGLPEEAIDRRKQRKLWAAAMIYLEKKKIKSKDMRFDVVSVDLRTDKARILKNAFYVDF